MSEMFEVAKLARLKTERILKNRGFSNPINLPLLDGFVCKNEQNVANRLVNLYGLIALSHDNVNVIKLKNWMEKLNVFDELTEDEKELFQKKKNNTLSSQEIHALSWKRESLFTLMWCTNLINQIPFPTHESKVEEYLLLLPPKKEFVEFSKSLRLRVISDIIHKSDLHYCLHWIIRNDDINAVKGLSNRSMDVVIERRHSLEWILSPVDWNDVFLDT